MANDKLTIEEYQTLLQKAETENRHLRWKAMLHDATTRGFNMRDVINALSGITDGAVFFLDENLNISFFEGSNCLQSRLAKELLKRDTLRFSEFLSVLPQNERILETALENGNVCYSGQFVINTIEPFHLLLIT